MILGRRGSGPESDNPDKWLSRLNTLCASGNFAAAARLLEEEPQGAAKACGFGGPLRRALEEVVFAVADIGGSPGDLPAVRMVLETELANFRDLRNLAAAICEPVIFVHFPVQQPNWRGLVLEIEALASFIEDPAYCMVYLSGFDFMARRELILSPRLGFRETVAPRFFSDEFIHLSENRDPFRFSDGLTTIHGCEVYRYTWCDEGPPPAA